MAFVADEADLFESMLAGERVADLVDAACCQRSALSVRLASARELADLVKESAAAADEARAVDAASRLATCASSETSSSDLSAALRLAAHLCAPVAAPAATVTHTLSVPNAGCLRLRTLESKTAALGGRLWPSGELLVTHVLAHDGAAVTGARVLELGAGAGFCGLAALHMGAACVMLTDTEPGVLELLAANAAANPHPTTGATAQVASLTWYADDGDAAIQPARDVSGIGCFDIILASDVLYHDDQALPLANTIAAHLRAGGVAHVVCPVRSSDVLERFAGRATSLGMRITRRYLGCNDGRPYEFEYMKLEATPEG